MECLEKQYRTLIHERDACRRDMEPYPFLQRVRNVRYVLTLSATTFGILARYLNAGDGRTLPMSTMLQARCSIAVERREPVGVVPTCVL